MTRLLAAIGLIVTFTGTGWAQTQTYPNRPIRFIVPYAPGGGSDATARILAQRMPARLGQSVVVDNRPGAGGIVGIELAAKSPPDGYTIVLGGGGALTMNPSLYRKLPYDSIRDFAPVSLILNSPSILAVHPSFPVRTVKELIAFSKAHPDKVSYGSSGNGGSSHLAGALFNSLAGTKMVHVPYRGAGPAAVAVVSGEVPVIFADVFATLTHIKSGRLRGVAVTSVKRSPAVPELPTIAEAGVPQYESGTWFGVLAPAGTPHEIIARLNSELVAIANAPDLRQKLAAEGSDVVASSPEQFAETIKVDIARWAKIIKEAAISID